MKHSEPVNDARSEHDGLIFDVTDEAAKIEDAPYSALSSLDFTLGKAGRERL